MSFLQFRKKPQKKLKIITKEKMSAPQKEENQPKSKIEELTHDERVALEVYEALKKQMKLKDLPKDHPAQRLRSYWQAMSMEKTLPKVPWTDYDP